MYLTHEHFSRSVWNGEFGCRNPDYVKLNYVKPKPGCLITSVIPTFVDESTFVISTVMNQPPEEESLIDKRF